MSKRKRLVSGFFCLTLLLTFLGGMSASAETVQEEWFQSTPTSAVFNSLWVDDIVCFSSQFHYGVYDEDGNYVDAGQPALGNTMTILSGDCVEIVDADFGVGVYCKCLKFTKPGEAKVSIQETNHETGESREKTFSFTVTQRPADKPATATYNHSLGNMSMKIGETLKDTVWKNFWQEGDDNSDTLKQLLSVEFHNANYGLYSAYDTYDGPFGKIDLKVESLFYFGGGLGGGSCPLVGDDRIAGPQMYAYNNLAFLGESYAFKPGTKSLDLSYGDCKNLGNIGSVTVEEPVITTNAPASVKVGSTLNLTTALTNTALKNLKTSEYEDENNYYNNDHSGFEGFLYKFDERGNNPIAYKPSVTVIEGMDCVSQSEQDYSNTLTSSETLTFKKAGTVKLKVTYTQFATDSQMLYTYDWNNETGEYIRNENDKRYHPEKIITIQITEDGEPIPSLPEAAAVMITDEETGVKVNAAEGVLPSDTTLIVSPSNFVLEGAAGKYVAFDISLENGGVKIQPNGKVQISIPVPDGYNKDSLTVYYVTDDGSKTELPCTIEEDVVTFETDHFSLYVLAEKENTQSAVTSPQTGDNAYILLWLTLLAVGGCGLIITAATRKKYKSE